MPNFLNISTGLIEETQSTRDLAPIGVAIQYALMGGLSVVTIFLFNILRPNNKIIYEPKIKYYVGNKKPPPLSDGFFGWLSPLIHTKEPVLVDKVGLDAVIFLRFLRLMRWLFGSIALLGCVTLLPIDIVYNLKNVPSKQRDPLSMMTIRDVQGTFVWVHVAVSYLINFLVMGFTWHHWRHVVRLRQAFFRSPEYADSFYARTLMVEHVPKKSQTDDGIKGVFEAVQVPYPTTSVHIGRRVGRLPELIEYHNKTVREFEQVLVTYMRGGKLAKERPKKRIGGFMCCGGQQVDAIDFYTAKLKRTEIAIEEYRNQIDNRKAESYGFASMAAVPHAHIVARMLQGKHPKGTHITLAPNPKDIIWNNLNLSESERASKKTVGWFWLAFVCFINTVPLLILSVLANMANLASIVPFISEWAAASNATFAIVSGVLPPAVSALFSYFLPRIMRRLSRFQGATTRSRLDRAVLQRYFMFLIISQLIIFTLISVLFTTVVQIVHDVGEHESFADIWNSFSSLPANIKSTYLNQAPYWLTFFPLRGYIVVFDLAQIINLVVIWLKTLFLGRTPRDIREWTQPPDFEYAIYYSNMLYMGAVGLVFAPLAPLIAVAASLVFFASSFVYKYQLMFVFTTKVESAGRMWNPVINRLLFATVLMQLMMIFTVGVSFGFKHWLWIAAVPPVFFIVIFKIYLSRSFKKQFTYYVPSDDDIRSAKVHSAKGDDKGNRLARRFGHPALHADLFTPMLHARMMPLLREIYSGRLEGDKAKMDEYGGKQLDAQIVPGGIKIAAIDQNDLEYDPVLYRRDRGDDWDARSIASTTIFGSDNASVYNGKAGGSTWGGRQVPHGYDGYLANGPGGGDGIEMARLDPGFNDQLPLLTGQPEYPPSEYTYHMQGASTSSLPGYPAASPMELRSNSPFPGPSHSPQPGEIVRSYSPYPNQPGGHQRQQSGLAEGYPRPPRRQNSEAPSLNVNTNAGGGGGAPVYARFASSPNNAYPPRATGSPAPSSFNPPRAMASPTPAMSRNPSEGYREAPLHRPNPSSGSWDQPRPSHGSRQNSYDPYYGGQ